MESAMSKQENRHRARLNSVEELNDGKHVDPSGGAAVVSGRLDHAKVYAHSPP